MHHRVLFHLAYNLLMLLAPLQTSPSVFPKISFLPLVGFQRAALSSVNQHSESQIWRIIEESPLCFRMFSLGIFWEKPRIIKGYILGVYTFNMFIFWDPCLFLKPHFSGRPSPGHRTAPAATPSRTPRFSTRRWRSPDFNGFYFVPCVHSMQFHAIFSYFGKDKRTELLDQM